jgi:hypothetical protein
MKRMITLLTAALVAFGANASAANSAALNYQEYCDSGPPACSAPSCMQAPCPPPFDPCAPCAPVCGTECGVSVCAIGVAILAIVAAAAIILSSETEHVH